MIRKIVILFKPDLQVAVTSKLPTTFQKSYSSEAGKKDDSGKCQNTTLSVSECTNRDFSQPVEPLCRPPLNEPHCSGVPPDPLPALPKQCKLDKAGPVDYDDGTCDRGYVNPCKPQQIPECMPVANLLNCRFQKCGQASLMDTLPLPEDPGANIDQKGVLRSKLYFLLSLMIASGIVYKLWALGLLSDTGPPPRKKQVKRKSRRPQVIVKNPTSSSDIPDSVPYLLIGGGTASFSAFRAIKSIDAAAKVLVVTNEPYNPYMKPPLSKEIFYDENRSSASHLMYTQTDGSERSLFFEEAEFYIPCTSLMAEPNGGVAVARGWSVTRMDPAKKIAVLEDGKEIKYEKCLLAVGSTPKNIPAFANTEDEIQERVTLYRGVFDFEELEEIIANGAKSIVVVGGGFLGSELACSLARRGRKQGMQVTQIYPEESNLELVLPKYLCDWTKKMIRKEGVRILPRTKVEYAYMKNNNLELLLSDGNTLTADQVIVAVGVVPNTTLAEPSNLEVDVCGSGGFMTNAELELRSGLYAAGDCASFYDEKYGRRTIGHHDNAVVSGRLAGENMASAQGKPYSEHTMFWTDLGPNITFEAIGLVDPSLPTVGIYAKTEPPPQDRQMPTVEAEPNVDGNASGDNSMEATVGLDDEDEDEEEMECEDEEEVDTVEREMEEEECEEETEETPVVEVKKEREVVPTVNVEDVEEPDEEYTRGILFYLKDDIVVGIVLWNLLNKLNLAKKVLKERKRYDDLNEVAKLFTLHPATN